MACPSTPCSNNIRIGLWGDNGAPNFDVGKNVNYIKEVTVYWKNAITGLKISYVDIQGKPLIYQAGRLDGESQTFTLDSDDSINSVSGTFKGFDNKICISKLKFSTKLGHPYGPYGPGGGDKFSIQVADGSIVGFYGLAECYINSIGFYLNGEKIRLAVD